MGDLAEIEVKDNVAAVSTREKPWERRKSTEQILVAQDFPPSITVVEANRLYIPKEGISARALNRIKRLAAFQNPQFYKTQRMRMSTYGIPRIISSLDETADYVGLPRGCKPALAELLTQAGVSVKFEDKRNAGTSIPVRFTGVLREEQQLAANALLQHDNGTLSLPTAFGKTVIGAALIDEKKCNTLILVHLQTLLAQWKRSLEQFLVIETVSQEKKRKPRSAIGQTGQGRNTVTGIVDIANH